MQPGADPPVSGLFDISGRTALVTGSTRGIGRALAQGLLAAGCTVVVNGRDPDTTAAAASQLAQDPAVAPGARAVPCAFDVTDPAAVQRAFTS